MFRNVLLLAAALVISACTAPSQYVESTSQFTVASDLLADSTEKILTLSDTANLDQALFVAEYGGGTIDKSYLRNPLFSPADLAARRSALAALRQYAAALTAIASHDRGPDFYTKMQSLKSSVLQLQDHTHHDHPAYLARLEAQTGAIADLVSDLGQVIISAVQAEALQRSILRAAGPMNKLSDMLNQDMALVFDKIKNVQIIKFASVSEHFNVRACASQDVLLSDQTCQTLIQSCVRNLEGARYCKRLKSGEGFPQTERSALADVARQAGIAAVTADQAQQTFTQAQKAFQASVSKLVGQADPASDPSNSAEAATIIASFMTKAQTLAIDTRRLIETYQPATGGKHE
jgi:hypothetical protein